MTLQVQLFPGGPAEIVAFVVQAAIPRERVQSIVVDNSGQWWLYWWA